MFLSIVHCQTLSEYKRNYTCWNACWIYHINFPKWSIPKEHFQNGPINVGSIDSWSGLYRCLQILHTKKKKKKKSTHQYICESFICYFQFLAHVYWQYIYICDLPLKYKSKAFSFCNQNIQKINSFFFFFLGIVGFFFFF